MEYENPLRAARTARGLSLEEVAARTALGLTRVADLDAGRFERLPGGLYARAYVRAFAGVVGLEPGRVLEEIGNQLPGAPDPLPVLREVVRERGPDTIGEYVTQFITERIAVFTPPVARYAAAAVDGALLLLLNGGIGLVTAAFCGVRLATLLNAAGPSLIPVAVLTSVLYFLLLAGIGGLTPGARLCGLSAPSPAPALGLPAIRQRAWQAALHEGSILVDLIIECAAGTPRKPAESAESLG